MSVNSLTLQPLDSSASFTFDCVKARKCFQIITWVALPIIVGILFTPGVLATSLYASRTIAAIWYCIGGVLLIDRIIDFYETKARYNEMCPNGNFCDFCKRDWSEFSDKKYHSWLKANFVLRDERV